MCGRAWNTRAASQSQEREDSAELDLVASGEYVGYALVSDDNGKWAFTDGGMAPVAPKGGFAKTVGITAIADPCMWQDSPRAAIAYARRIKEEGH